LQKIETEALPKIVNLLQKQELAMRINKLAIVLALLIGIAVGHTSALLNTSLHAQDNAQIAEVPKAFGTFKAAIGNSMVFEAADGMLRIVDGRTGRVVRQVARQ
jgi:hypothetical protein